MTISTLSHGIVDNMHGLDRLSYGYQEVWWGWDGGVGDVCEQALLWQMGPSGILQGAVPPYGKPPSPDEEQNSRSSCLRVPPAPASDGEEAEAGTRKCFCLINLHWINQSTSWWNILTFKDKTCLFVSLHLLSVNVFCQTPAVFALCWLNKH